MKKDLNKKGFTLAEILITMLILLVVSAAIIPVLGPKKIKVPRINTVHGLFECYWYLNEDGSERLMQFSRGTGDDSAEPSDVTNRGYCNFNVPKANFFKLEMMGAGGNGYGVNASGEENEIELGYLKPSIEDSNDSITGYISALPKSITIANSDGHSGSSSSSSGGGGNPQFY